MNWRELNAKINDMGEAELATMLEQEKTGPRRVTIAVRLHQRLCALRAERERHELMWELNNV